jgi:hypothetical protein
MKATILDLGAFPGSFDFLALLASPNRHLSW